MPHLDGALGPLLVGTYANTILYTLEFLAVIQYYSASKRNRDPRILQAVVYFILLLDTLSTCNIYAFSYLYMVTHWGDPNYLQKQHWPCIVFHVMNGISEMIVQSFLIYRYWRLSKNFYISSLLVVFMLTALTGWAGLLNDLLIYPAYAQIGKLTLFTMIWFCTSAGADIAIALALFWQLSRFRSVFKSTQSLLRKLTTIAIQTGTVTSAFVVVILITCLVDKQSNVPTGFGFCLGRVYALTLLYNLNYRSVLISDEHCEVTESVDTIKFVGSLAS